MNFFQKPLEIFLKDSIIEIVFEKNRSGNNGEKVTPVPIPNTEVKLLSADGSWDFVPVRVGRCQATPLGLFLCSKFITAPWSSG